uniref:Reticulophagy regulator 1 n=1 Tax=Myripristis murdjan TaxID=586833 RepID=A0A667YH32_9TELE
DRKAVHLALLIKACISGVLTVVIWQLWEIIDSGQDSRSGTGLQFSDSFKLFLQETSSFKQQNPGKISSWTGILRCFSMFLMSISVSLWQLDSTVCKEMSVSDTEVSDVTWTDNGTFNLSEGHTPQTENSEDLDREEAFTGGLPEFPSLDNGTATNGDDDEDLSIGLPTPPPQPQQLIKSKHTAQPHKDQPIDKALELVNQMAGDVIAAAVTAAIQERIEAALAEESDSEVEDFELLDQSELEQLEGELGLGEEKAQAKEEAQAKTSKPPSSAGFFSKLLGRH